MGVMHIPGHTNQAPREVSLEEIRALLGDCRLCQLAETRTNIVFGVGDPHARVRFIGEAPGRNEDLQGEPFVGAAGQNLNRILSFAGLTREEIYIANVLKCRPPGNRNPRPEEVQVCAPFLREQIRSIWPDIIVTMGNPATHFVLKTEVGITKLRGRFHQMGHFRVLPTFHPAAALRNPAWQELIEQDFRMLGQFLAEHPAGEPLDSVAQRSDALPEVELPASAGAAAQAAVAGAAQAGAAASVTSGAAAAGGFGAPAPGQEHLTFGAQ